MSRTVDLGRLVVGGAHFSADLDVILRSNLLVQANSGGGKSWLLRRLIEQSFGKVPQIVIDPEGEFSTLREKFDIILVGKDGDTPADVRSASLLAHRLLELGVSAVIDLFEMSPPTRPAWVAIFIQSLVEAPKKLWRDLVVYVDEAHTLAPEPGHGASESVGEKRCRSALIDLAARGRKRGFGTVAATQRLGKLSKDFAAELKNVMIGQTFIDIDRERAAGCLGIAKADKQEFFKRVKNLSPGNFYAMGRALLLEPTLVQVGGVQTEHPEAGKRQASPPPPTGKILHLLPHLADLPREAEAKIATEKDLRDEISRLKKEMAAKPIGPVREVRVEVPVVPEGSRLALKRLHEQAEKSSSAGAHLASMIAELVVNLEAFIDTIPLEGQLVALRKLESRVERRESTSPSPRRIVTNPEGSHLMPGEIKILTAAAQHPGGVSKEQLGVLTGYKRSSRDTYLQRLRVAGYVEESGGQIVATTDGIEALGEDYRPLPTGPDLLVHWRKELSVGERRILDEIVDAYPNAIDKEDIDTATGYKRSSRDTYLQRLRSRRLIVDGGGGQVRAAEELF
jgi:mRNA-degrading endonuclease RelE of RelBE toxin-antitoxin system